VIERVIDFSLRHRGLVLALVVLLAAAGAVFTARLKLDALPDLSESQVIIKAEFSGQPPRLVEDQLTYPLAASLLGIPGANSVRAFSMFGEAYVYIVFNDGVDPYWARTRVLERTSKLASRLPAGATTSLGPDASGTGWVYQYALVSPNGTVPVDRLRALQEFLLKQELQSVPGVAEVATFGGAARQLQIDVDPRRLVALGLTAEQIGAAIRDANQARGGGALEIGRQRFFVSSESRVQAPEDLQDIPVGQGADGSLLRLRQVARVSYGPAPKEGVADLNGEGDVVGGIVVMRQGENAERTVQLLKARLAELRPTLPPDVELIATYDRSTLIHAAIASLATRLLEEAAVVALVCTVFLWRLRSALVAIITLPLGLLAALTILQWQGTTANIMSLGGLAIAIGAMIDAAVVMVETLHRKAERRQAATDAASRWALVRESALEVGPALFFSLLVITVSFLPVFSLTGQEGKLFAPLALTKTYAMAAAAVLSVTLVPILMGLLIKGAVVREHRNLVNRVLKRIYRPLLKAVLQRPVRVMVASALIALTIVIPLSKMGSEFMPPLDEGDLLYMPTTLPSVSLDEAAEILAVTNRLIREMPEVAMVHGKAGRSDSATDPAPLSMIETTILLKPRSQWPEKISTEELMRRLDERVRLAGLTNSWGFPIRTRIDMLATGVKTPLALKISGPDLRQVQQLSVRAEQALKSVPGVRAAFAERATSGRFIEIRIDRQRASLFGVRAADLSQLIEGPVGGMPVDTLYAGRERYPIVVRFPRADRDSIKALEQLRLRTMAGSVVSVAQIASIEVVDGPIEIKSENARPVGYVLLDLGDGNVGGILAQARAALQEPKVQEPGYTLSWTGQYLRLEEASSRLLLMTLATLLSVLAILYFHFRSWPRIAIVMVSMPFAVTGAAWFTYALGYRWSFATAVGFLALAGVAAEFCVVMLLYLDQALREQPEVRPQAAALRRAVLRGALLRLRPKSMTVAVILGGLIPLLLSEGAGVDVMRRIAAPMVGGMITAPLFSLFVVPAIYVWWLGRPVPAEPAAGEPTQAASSSCASLG